MATVSTILVYLAVIGAILSFIAGAIYAARAGAGALAIVWPFAVARIRRAGGEPAALVNKALVALIACLLLGGAAFSAAANLHRFAK
jgi:hypothetical protein